MKMTGWIEKGLKDWYTIKRYKEIYYKLKKELIICL